MKFTKKINYLLISFLLSVNMIARYPVTPHAVTGSDSFIFWAFGMSISKYGYAKWIIHPLSFFGYYPYSEPSSTPFLVSGISQITGLNMEATAWVYSIMIGLCCALFAYILAGKIYDNDLFKFSVALIYSLAPRTIFNSTWNTESRALLLIFIPLFLFLFLKVLETKNKKYIVLCVITFLMAFTAHKGAIFLILFIIPWFFPFIYSCLKKPENIKNIVFSRKFRIILLAMGGILLFFPLTEIGAEFLSPFFYNVNPTLSLKNILNLGIGYGGQVGLASLFLIGGLLIITLKKYVKENEIYLLSLFVIISPVILISYYASLFTLIVPALLGGIFIKYFYSLFKRKGKVIYGSLVICLIASVSMFPGLTMGGHYPLFLQTDKNICPNYVTEAQYNAFVWDQCLMNGTVKTNYGLSPRRYSLRPSIDEHYVEELIHDHIEQEDIEVKFIPPWRWLQKGSAYIWTKLPTSSPIRHRYGYTISKRSVDSDFSRKTIKMFNLYAYENKYIENYQQTPFFSALQEKRYKVFSNEKINIWEL